MAPDSKRFDLCGPMHLTNIDWRNPDHRRSIAASLVQGVYTLEYDREKKLEGTQAFAPPWWSFFHFKKKRVLIDDVDESIFGVIYEYIPKDDSTSVCPSFVIAFRGTIIEGEAVFRDVELDCHIIRNGLRKTSRFEIAIQAVRDMVDTYGSSKLWLAGHSLGSAIAMLCGKTMAKNGVLLEVFLFNPPFVSAPTEKIRSKILKHGIRIASSFFKAGYAYYHSIENESFAALSTWVPFLYLNPSDYICSGYLGYFEHREKMEKIGAGKIEDLATQHSIRGLVKKTLGKESEEPMHLIPSANVIINLTRARYTLKEAHGIHQWWRFDLPLQSKTYHYQS